MARVRGKRHHPGDRCRHRTGWRAEHGSSGEKPSSYTRAWARDPCAGCTRTPRRVGCRSRMRARTWRSAARRHSRRAARQRPSGGHRYRDGRAQRDRTRPREYWALRAMRGDRDRRGARTTTGSRACAAPPSPRTSDSRAASTGRGRDLGWSNRRGGIANHCERASDTRRPRRVAVAESRTGEEEAAAAERVVVVVVGSGREKRASASPAE